MQHQKKKDLRFYDDARRSNGCWCEAYKHPGMPFCWSCWQRLPEDLRRDFFGKRIGGGYEEAYDAAVQWLSE